MDLQQLLLILRAHMSLIVSTVLMFAGIAIALTFLTPSMYTATTSVVIDFESHEPFSASANPNVPISPGYLSTQIDIAESHTVAVKVVQRLALDRNEKFIERFQRATRGRGSLTDWIAGQLRKDLDIKPVRESRVVHIGFSARDAQFAAAAADAFAEAFIRTRLELSVGPARRNSVWLEEQLKGLRVQVEEAQARLTAYQQKNQIVGANNERLDTEMQRYSDLSAELSRAQSQVHDVRARQLGPNHPAYQRALAQEQSLQQALAAQKLRVLNLKRQHDDIAVLFREVESAQRTYDAAMQRYNQSSLEGQANQASVSLLNRAVVPLRPSSPRMEVNLPIGVLLGLIIGVGMALYREISNRRIRTESDLTQALGLPMYGVLEKAGV
jgi:succinoglycan biosynthesis transport protein ExoP